MISVIERYRQRAAKLRAKAVESIRPELFDVAKSYDELANKLEHVLEPANEQSIATR